MSETKSPFGPGDPRLSESPSRYRRVRYIGDISERQAFLSVPPGYDPPQLLRLPKVPSPGTLRGLYEDFRPYTKNYMFTEKRSESILSHIFMPTDSSMAVSPESPYFCGATPQTGEEGSFLPGPFTTCSECLKLYKKHMGVVESIEDPLEPDPPEPDQPDPPDPDPSLRSSILGVEDDDASIPVSISINGVSYVPILSAGQSYTNPEASPPKKVEGEYTHCVMYRDGRMGTLCDSGAWGRPVLFTAVTERATCPGCRIKLDGKASR